MTDAEKSPRRSTRAARAGAVLYRSRIEIIRILARLARDKAVLSAELGEPGQLFLSRVLHVDRAEDFFILAYSEERQANAALLAQASVAFVASEQRGRIEFLASAPVETVYEGVPAIRFTIPQALVRSQSREHPRFKVPADSSLRCIADSAGVASFEARIVDISRGGLGGMIYDSQVTLMPGTVLRGCKIILAGSKPVVADLEVRHTAPVVLADGSLARRSGVKFIGEPEGLDALVQRFVVESDEDRRSPR